jgi:hypothetical protein
MMMMIIMTKNLKIKIKDVEDSPTQWFREKNCATEPWLE